MSNSKVIGTPTPLLDGQAKITGALRYAPDLNLPGMLHARLVVSSYAHAKILNIGYRIREPLIIQSRRAHRPKAVKIDFG